MILIVSNHLPLAIGKLDSPAEELRGFDTFNALLGLEAEEWW